MSITITFDLSESDLDHFREVMRRAGEKTSHLAEAEIIENARKLLGQVWTSNTSDFIRERMHRLETIISMAVDKGWALEAEDRSRAMLALSYFSDPQDLIPDDIPGLGFLDDAIMIDLVAKEMEHEIQAYRDFCEFRDAESSSTGEDLTENSSDLQRAEWLEERRAQLHTRMRRRRQQGSKSGRGGGSSPFSLFRQAD